MTTPFLQRWTACAGLVLLPLAGCHSSSKYSEPPPGSHATTSLSVELGGSEKTISGAKVGPAFFQTAGVAPLLGRVFSTADHDSAATVVLLSERLWRDSFGRDPSLIGRQIRVNGQAVTIVGVMPAFFDSPRGELLWMPGDELVAR